MRSTIALAVLLIGVSAAAQDPLAVNAKTIQLKMENDRVRVLEARLPPGAKEELHSHPAYVTYVVSGGKAVNHTSDGKTSQIELKSGDVVYRDATTHWAENTGTTEIHLILVELKSKP